MWARDGLITITGGESDYKNDYKFIIKELIELRDKYDLTYIAVITQRRWILARLRRNWVVIW